MNSLEFAENRLKIGQPQKAPRCHQAEHPPQPPQLATPNRRMSKISGLVFSSKMETCRDPSEAITAEQPVGSRIKARKRATLLKDGKQTLNLRKIYLRCLVAQAVVSRSGLPPPKDVTCISLQTNSRTCKSAAAYLLPRQLNPDFTMKPPSNDQDYPQTPDGESRSAKSKKPPTEEPKHKRADAVRSSNRLIGAGMELAGFAIIPAILGLGIDRWTQTDMPYFTAAGTLMGFVGGMVQFVRQIKANQ
ncbi:MAG: AtpZ/AtpI family protein [Planctomycetota bacterium]|nr:AtpZ/AtpI family protein [Planctomycetota bacterium]